MNDIYARRASQALMFHQAQRCIPTLYAATRVTKEPLNGAFVREEFMRINGHHQLPVLIPEVAAQTHHTTHWHHLHSTCAWADSHRAYAVGHQTPMSQRFGDIGLMTEQIAPVRGNTTPQAVVQEHVARVEGTAVYDPVMSGADRDELEAAEPAPADE